MKNSTFSWVTAAMLALVLTPFYSGFAQCLPSLGSAANFTIFSADGALSNVTASTIQGNIGTNAGTITGFETSTISGTTYLADAVTQSAANDLLSAYTAFQSITPNFSHLPNYGNGETLLPGVYNVSTAGSITGTLIFDAQNNPNAKFVLLFGGAFTSGTYSTIVLTNGATANNIYWVANGAFSLAANCLFKGTIIANGAISVGVGNQLNCKLLSTSGAISTYGTQLTIDGIDNSSPYYYADADQDGYGDLATSSCIWVAGSVLNATDCDDTNAAVHPNAIEIYENELDDNCNGITDADTTICGYATTWNGSSWSNGVPNYGKTAIFTASYTSTADMYACSVWVTNNATLTLHNTLFVYKEMTVDPGSFFMLSNNNNIIQILPSAVNSGNLTVSRNTSTLVRLDHTLWSSPVSSQNLYAFSPQTLTHRFYTYDTATDTYLSSKLSASSVFIAAKGYAIRAANNQSSTVPAEWTGTFTGVPNNGTHPFALTFTGTNNCNLVGNPYPSTIDAATFVNANAGVIKGTLYFYAHTLSMDANGLFPTGTNYASWNATGGTAATAVAINNPAYHTPAEVPNGSIQVGQGFFVVAKTSGVLNFTNTQRVNNQQHQFLRALPTEQHHVWLNVTTDLGADINQFLVGYVDGATAGIDANYDGESYGNTGSYMYSSLEGGAYVIQGRPLPFVPTDEVPLGWVCETPGNYSIKLSEKDGIFLGNQGVYIRDNQTNSTVNITNTPYVFTSDSGSFTNRFTLVYQENMAAAAHTLDAKKVIVYKSNGAFHLATGDIQMQAVFVYDLSGRLLCNLNGINHNQVILPEINQTKQLLLIKIVAQDQQTVTIKTLN